MKLISHLPVRGMRRQARGEPAQSPKPRASGLRSGFTMIEIALCLAIIGFALVSILLVLPLGMNTQRDTRQETIVGQDATVLLEAIRTGSRGLDDLTNNVYAITNYWTEYLADGSVGNTGINGYTYNNALEFGSAAPAMVLTNGLRIIGLLSTPEFLAGNQPITSTLNTVYTSNHVVAYVRSISGLAAEKPPQDNSIMRDDTFGYRVLCVNAPMAADTNSLAPGSPFFSAYNQELTRNQRELRLTFLWPQLPNGNVGGFRQTFRATIGGPLMPTNYDAPPVHLYPGISLLYFYQPQSFNTNAP
jgi:type II secretory pathway pseudopilin PulG